MQIFTPKKVRNIPKCFVGKKTMGLKKKKNSSFFIVNLYSVYNQKKKLL